jgi:hypothetical protein
LLDEVERRWGSVVDLAADYYWTVSPRDGFSFEGEAPGPTLGQLTNDVRSMQDLLAEETIAPVAVWHDLAHLIGILTRLGALDQES